MNEKGYLSKCFRFVFAVLSTCLIIAMLATNGFGLTEPYPKASLNDYDWAELRAIAAKMDQAPNDEAAFSIASEFNLCRADGTLDPENKKSVTLTNGEKRDVYIIGIRHDEKADGTGKASLTFSFSDPVGNACYNDTLSDYGGWGESALRERIIAQDLIPLVPMSIRNGTCFVLKVSNNVGAMHQEQPLTGLEERFFILSSVEYCGKDAVIAAGGTKEDVNQGTQYQLYKEIGSNLGFNEPIWTRTPSCLDSELAWAISSSGTPEGLSQVQEHAILLAFCF